MSERSERTTVASSERSERATVASDGDDPVAVTAALDGLLRSLRGGAGRAEVGGVFGRWEEAVGAPIAANVRPVRLEHGTLLVEVIDPAWATQVRLLGDDVRRRLLDVTGVVVGHIDVRVGRPGRR